MVNRNKDPKKKEGRGMDHLKKVKEELEGIMAKVCITAVCNDMTNFLHSSNSSMYFVCPCQLMCMSI